MSKFSFRFFILLLLIVILVTPTLSQTRSGKLGVGIDGSMQYMTGAGDTKPSLGFGGGINMSYSIMDYLSIRSKFCINQLGWTTSSNAVVSNPPSKSIVTDMMSLCAYLSGDLMPNSSFNVFPFIGGGVAFYDPKNDNGYRAPGISSSDINLIGGVGADYFLNEFWSITFMCEYVMTNSPYYAGSYSGNNPNDDTYLRGSLQIRYYFFDQSFITKLLDAQRARLKHK